MSGCHLLATFLTLLIRFRDIIFSSLSRFHNISKKMEDTKNIEDIRSLLDELKREMSLLSVSERTYHSDHQIRIYR